MIIVIVFKNGYELKMKCSDFSITTTSGKLTKCKFEGVSENDPIYFDCNEVLCIYRVMSDEVV